MLFQLFCFFCVREWFYVCYVTLIEANSEQYRISCFMNLVLLSKWILYSIFELYILFSAYYVKYICQSKLYNFKPSTMIPVDFAASIIHMKASHLSYFSKKVKISQFQWNLYISSKNPDSIPVCI